MLYTAIRLFPCVLNRHMRKAEEAFKTTFARLKAYIKAIHTLSLVFYPVRKAKYPLTYTKWTWAVHSLV